jgi:basic amino acid/polyamine antiporter, APA family
VGLQRRLNRIDAFAIALGGVVGVGVFRNTGLVVRGTDGFAAATALWIGVGIVCLAGATLYADLSARVPEAGGPYAYVRVAFGPRPAFVYGWMNGGVAIPARHAAALTVIGELITVWLPGDKRLYSIGMLLVLLGLNLLGVRAGALAQRVFTSGKLGTIVFVSGLAIVLALGPAPATNPILATATFTTALGAAWYTYLGWQDAVLLAEELHQPRRDLPVVLLGTVAAVMVLYCGIHVAVYLGLHGDAAAASDLPARAVAERAFGVAGGAVMTALMLSSMVGSAAEHLMVRTRILMALARDGLAPSRLAVIGRTGAPKGAMLAHSAIVLALIATGSFAELVRLLAFAQGFLGIFETASYFVVRKKTPEIPTSRFHPWAPLAFIAANATLCVLAAIAEPMRAGIVLGALAVLALIYAVVSSARTRA